MRGLLGREIPIAVLSIAVALLAGACGSSGSSGDASSDRPTTDARVEITSPAPNAVTGRIVDLAVRLDDARLVPAVQVGGRIRPDRGHLHVSVDGQLVSMPNRLRDRLPPMTPGTHTIQAEFVAADHQPFANRVVAAVTFRVR